MREWKKRGVENLTNDTPSKKGFWTPLPSYGAFSTPPQVSVLCFSCTKIHDRADQKLFGGVQKFSGERVLWYVLQFSADFRPSFSRKSGRKMFHEKSLTNCTGHETKFFHRGTLGAWGHIITCAMQRPHETGRFLFSFFSKHLKVQVWGAEKTLCPKELASHTKLLALFCFPVVPFFSLPPAFLQASHHGESTS